MAVVKGGTSGGGCIKYITKAEKTEEKLIDGINCNPKTAIEEMKFTKEFHNKTEGVQYYHFIQSFRPGETTPGDAHDIGREMALKLAGEAFQAVLATHIDRNHIHNHIVLNSVNFENGKKFHFSPKDLKQLKEFSNTLCREKELSTINFDKKAEKNITTGEYRLLMKGQDSWKEDLREAIDYTKARVDSIEEMKKFLKENFNVEMKIQNKNLKFKHPEKEEFCKGGRLGANYEKETIVNGIQHKILEEARHEKSLVSRKLELYNALERRTIYLEERTDEKGKPEVRASLDVNPFDLPKESKQFRSYPSFEEAIFYLIGEKGYRAVKEETVKINRLGEEERTTQKIEAEFNKKYFKKHEEKEKKQERDRGLSR